MENTTGPSKMAPHDMTGLPNASEELIDLEGLARRLGVGKRTVSRMVERGELPRPAIGQGGRPRWLWQYVVEFLRERHKRQAKVDARTRAKLT